MMWWFLILAFGIAAITWAGVSLYFRVRRHMRDPKRTLQTASGEVEIEPED